MTTLTAVKLLVACALRSNHLSIKSKYAGISISKK